jgi:hypothetical protein
MADPDDDLLKQTHDEMGLTMYRLLEAVSHYQMVLQRLEASGAGFCREFAAELKAIDRTSEDLLLRVDHMLARAAKPE